MKLTAKTSEVFDYIKKNGGKVSIPELSVACGRNERSVGANVLDLQKKGLVYREAIKTEDGTAVAYATLTEEGKSFVPSEDAE